MKIVTDHYRTGKSRHKPCEDYALSGSEPIPYLVVCDGCSSSPGSDIGAMLLSLSARNLIRELSNPDSITPDYHTFGNEVIHRAAAAAALLKVPQYVSDATLLTAFRMNEHIHVYVWGDGFVITEDRNDSGIHVREIRFESNAPYYLSYLLNEQRRMAYQRESDKPKILICSDGQPVSMRYDEPVSFEFRADELSMLLLASDGLASFADVSGNPVPVNEVINEFTAFKNYQGEFVKRRAKRAITDFEKRSVVNIDDVSVAGMYSEKASSFFEMRIAG